MSELKQSGIIHKIYPTNQVSDKFKKREFVIQTEEQYPQLVKFELTQEKCNDLDLFKLGAKVTVHFNLRGREWANKQNEIQYFNTLQCWRLEGQKSEPTTKSQTKQHEEETDAFSDSLPF